MKLRHQKSYITHIVSGTNVIPAFPSADYPWLELHPLSVPTSASAAAAPTPALLSCGGCLIDSTKYPACSALKLVIRLDHLPVGWSPSVWQSKKTTGEKVPGSSPNYYCSTFFSFFCLYDAVVSSKSEGHECDISNSKIRGHRSRGCLCIF